MKRFILLLTTIFICTIAYAENITINWSVDNHPYTTTTCEIGGDVVLPSVSKRGYIFRGWTPEHFDRGTFDNWSLVPTNANLYPKDYVGNKTPTNNDYMVVSDASDYVAQGEDLWVSNIARQYTTIRTADDSFDVPYGTVIDRKFCNDMIQIVTTPVAIYIYALGSVLYNNTRYDGTPENRIQMYYKYTDNSFGKQHFETIPSAPLSGTWRFIYIGTWATDGKNGWKPDYQITSNQDE